MEQGIPATDRATTYGQPIALGVVEGAWRQASDGALVAALRRGDQRAFAELHQSLAPLMIAIAMRYTRSRSVAEDIVQDAWLGVVQGIDRFEGRSSLKTWILRILHYRARTANTKEARSIVFSSLADVIDELQVMPNNQRFEEGLTPRPEQQSLEERVLGAEMGAQLARALATLPAMQRTVVVLRDVTGWSASEVCAHLGVSPVNQRVLLHRGRKQMRQALGAYDRS